MVTITPFKGRGAEVGQCVKVYRNLHLKAWSIMAVDGPYKGKVIAHADWIGLWGPKFIVNEAGRQRVLREGKKNVHAFVRGTISDYRINGRLVKLQQLTRYNPYRGPGFVYIDKDTGETLPLTAGAHITLDERKQGWTIGPRNRP